MAMSSASCVRERNHLPAMRNSSFGLRPEPAAMALSSAGAPPPGHGRQARRTPHRPPGAIDATDPQELTITHLSGPAYESPRPPARRGGSSGSRRSRCSPCGRAPRCRRSRAGGVGGRVTRHPAWLTLLGSDRGRTRSRPSGCTWFRCGDRPGGRPALHAHRAAPRCPYASCCRSGRRETLSGLRQPAKRVRRVRSPSSDERRPSLVVRCGRVDRVRGPAHRAVCRGGRSATSWTERMLTAYRATGLI